MLRALGSASCDIPHETGGTICFGYWVRRLVISYTRQGVRFVRALGSTFCDIYHIRNRRYDLFRTLGSASCDITHKTSGTIRDGHWVLRLVISLTRQEVRFIRGIGFFTS